MKLVSIISLILVSSQAFAGFCDIPFENNPNTGNPYITNPKTRTNFSQADAYNPNQTVENTFRYRYVVANLNSKENGQCKGLEEFYPKMTASNVDFEKFPDLRDPQELQHFLNNVQGRYYTPPVKKDPNAGGYCIGQTLSLCELRSGKPVEVARIATSSGAGGAPSRSTYKEVMKFRSRSWVSQSLRPYTAADQSRDSKMGGVYVGNASFHRTNFYNNFLMPYFMGFIPEDEGPGQWNNGAHEYSLGEARNNYLGAPVSHGCFRLTAYGATFMRWWLPREARMFIYYTSDGYRAH